MNTKATITTEFTREESDSLWAQHVDLDDWDYAIIGPPDLLHEERDEEGELIPKEYALQRMLTGCCANTWYLATLNGAKVAIGIAYHA